MMWILHGHVPARRAIGHFLAPRESLFALRRSRHAGENAPSYGLEAEQTFALSAAVGPEDVTEMLRVLRDITGGRAHRYRHAQPQPSPCATLRSVSPRGSTDEQLERARGEVMLEFEFLEVDRNKARALGITLRLPKQLHRLEYQRPE